MSQENVEVVRELHEHWARGDYAFADLLDPQIEFSRNGTQVGGVDLEGQWRGLDAMWAATLEWLRAFEDLRTEAERIIDLGDDRVLALARQTARGRESGAPIDHKLGFVFTLRDGKVVRCDLYWDRVDALEAAGLSE
jgi:ketosteroid isomerase-like protein